jgi:hypothetical protein
MSLLHDVHDTNAHMADRVSIHMFQPVNRWMYFDETWNDYEDWYEDGSYTCLRVLY